MVISCGILDAVDIACLSLTCKYLAQACLVTFISTTESESSENRALESCIFRAKGDIKAHHTLLHRLDVGWNRSNTKICYSCCVFRSMDPLYWVRREATNGRTKLWRVQNETYRPKTVRDFVKPWLEDHRQQLSLCAVASNLYDVQIEINEAGHLFLLCPECVPLSGRFRNSRKLKMQDLRPVLG